MERFNIESYEYGSPKINHFAPTTWDAAIDYLWSINDDEAVDMGYSGGSDDLWDAVTKEYMLTENKNALPPFF